MQFIKTITRAIASARTPTRKVILGLLLLPAMLFLETTAKGQSASYLIVGDKRSGDSLPNAYKNAARFEFKYRNIIHAPGTATYNGLLTLAPWSDGSGGPVYQMSFDPSGLYLRNGSYTAQSWGGWQRLVIESSAGVTKMGNGSISSGLLVDGMIKAKEVNVVASVWADDVFDKKYPLLPLPVLEKQISALGHLPGIPGEKQVLSEGINLGEMNKNLLRKVEELTLYIIDQHKKMKALEDKIGIIEEYLSNTEIKKSNK